MSKTRTKERQKLIVLNELALQYEMEVVHDCLKMMWRCSYYRVILHSQFVQLYLTQRSEARSRIS